MLRCIAPLLALHALVQAARLPPSVPTPSAASSKKRVLMLVCDTGGGHRASAQALEAAVHDLRPGGDVDVKIVDIWTEHGVFPYNKMAAGYPFLCAHRRRCSLQHSRHTNALSVPLLCFLCMQPSRHALLLSEP